MGIELDAIVQQHAAWDELDVAELDRVLAEIAGPNAAEILRSAHVAMLLRAIEMSVITHPAMVSMIRTPNVYLGNEAREIRKIFEAHKIEPIPEPLIDHFVAIIRGRVALNSTKHASTAALFGRVVSNQYASAQEMRCTDCGYHFRTADMSPDRFEAIKELELKLAATTPAARFRDLWKPATDSNRRATVDHIVPEAALGPADLDNFRVVCGFCNKRRQIARRHLESLANRVSAALLAIAGGDRGGWAMEAAVYFAVCHVGHCTVCLQTPLDAELTAIPSNRDYKWTGMLPWQFEVVCYAHSGL